MYSKIMVIVLLVSTICVVSCERLEVAVPDLAKEGPLKFSDIQISDGISATFGRFVAVTPHPSDGHWAALWFEQDNGTISIVWVNVVKRRIQENVLTIPRK